MEAKIALERYGHITCDPTWEVKEEGTVYHRLYYVYQGNVFYYANHKNKKYPLKKGHLYLFPIQQSYQIIHDPKDPLKCLWFHLALFPPVFNPMIEILINKKSSLFYLIKLLEKMVLEEKRDKELLINFLEGLITLIAKEEPLNFVNDSRLEKVLNYMHNNYEKKLSNSSLADLVSLNKQYFIRLFKENLNITPQKYLANYRLARASYLLNQGLDIVQVAKRVGYEDSKAFSRAFKRNKGVSPSYHQKNRFTQP